MLLEIVVLKINWHSLTSERSLQSFKEWDGYTNELLSGGTTNYFESGTTNSCIFSKSGTTNSWLFNRRIMNSIRIELKNIIKTYLS